jgi:hypothetical protein
MIELYVARGVSEEDATVVIETLWPSTRTVFLDLMMVEELGLMPPDESGLRRRRMGS